MDLKHLPMHSTHFHLDIIPIYHWHKFSHWTAHYASPSTSNGVFSVRQYQQTISKSKSHCQFSQEQASTTISQSGFSKSRLLDGVWDTELSVKSQHLWQESYGSRNSWSAKQTQQSLQKAGRKFRSMSHQYELSGGLTWQGFVPPPHSTAGCPRRCSSLAEQLSVAEADPKAADSQRPSCWTHCPWGSRCPSPKGDTGFSDGSVGKEFACQCRRHRRWGFIPWVGKIHWRRTWKPTPGFVPGESYGQRSLAGYGPRVAKELDMTEQLNNDNKKGHISRLTVLFLPIFWGYFWSFILLLFVPGYLKSEIIFWNHSHQTQRINTQSHSHRSCLKQNAAQYTNGTACGKRTACFVPWKLTSVQMQWRKDPEETSVTPLTIKFDSVDLTD